MMKLDEPSQPRACSVYDLRILWSGALLRRDRAGALDRLQARIRETFEELRRLRLAASDDAQRNALDVQLSELADIVRGVETMRGTLATS